MIRRFIFFTIFILFLASVLTLSVRGRHGSPPPEVLNTNEWRDDGPLELSPERGRYALVLSVVEEASFHFSLPIARLATPDLGYAQGKYVSLFAPGVSFIVAPGYLIGKYFGLAQTGTFAVIAVFALVNTLLIYALSVRLGAHPLAAALAGCIFLFATPAYAYAVTLYQHHISTFLILSSLAVLLTMKGLWPLIFVWFMIAVSIPVDYPNVFLMAPIALASFARFFAVVHKEKRSVLIVRLAGFLTPVLAILPIAFFLWFNFLSYGNPYQLSGTLPSVKAIDQAGNPTLPDIVGETQKDVFTDPTQQKKSAVGFFKTRQLLNGLYIHFVSPDRGVLYYAPIVFLGFLGAAILVRKKESFVQILLGIIGMNVLLYSMWGDPWGGWAFGSRYLIPSYAILATLIAIALTQWQKKSIFLIFVFLLLSYCVSVNTLGALTTNRNPPLIEILSLEAQTGKQEKYTYGRNFDYLLANRSKSYVFQTYASATFSAWDYYLFVTLLIIGVTGYMLFLLRFVRGGRL